MVRMVAGRYSFFPKSIEVPAENPAGFPLGEHGRAARRAYPHDQYEHHDRAGYVAEVHTTFRNPVITRCCAMNIAGWGHNHM